MVEHCVDHPKCREDLIKRINLRMTTKSFITSLGIVVLVGGIVAGLAYDAYSQRQKTLQESVEEQTKTTQQVDKKLTEIEVNQRHVMDEQQEFKAEVIGIQSNQQRILEEIIKIREHQVNGQ